MPKTQTSYVCSACGTSHPKWAGRCPSCGAWNTLEEAAAVSPAQAGRFAETRLLTAMPLTKIAVDEARRLSTGFAEVDRPLGGGIVPGSIILVGGEPGIGKSTLLLQVSGNLAKDREVLYVSGEESPEQLALRAKRLGVVAPSLKILPATNSDNVARTLAETMPKLAIVDSIQTMSTDRFSSGPGSITQVRESAAQLQAVAKEHGVPVIIVGHVTKEGSIAGPKVLEHLVDVVLYLEGEKWHGYRLLRGAKNRFGPTDEVGVFTMDEQGLADVTDPAGVFVDEATTNKPGTAVTASLEGTRTLFVEVQALSVPTSFGYPKRTASGIDLNKLQLLIAVLSKHAGLKLASLDLYCNVSGGYQLREPGGDLAVALAIASAVQGKPVTAGTVVIGELGLSGEVRPVQRLAKRLEEAARTGFRRAIVPRQSMPKKLPTKFSCESVATVGEAVRVALSGERTHAA